MRPKPTASQEAACSFCKTDTQERSISAAISSEVRFCSPAVSVRARESETQSVPSGSMRRRERVASRVLYCAPSMTVMRVSDLLAIRHRNPVSLPVRTPVIREPEKSAEPMYSLPAGAVRGR